MKHDRLIIIGAGGHGKVVRAIAVKTGYHQIDFLDDAPQSGIPTLGPVAEYVHYVAAADFFVAIGNNRVRERLIHEIQKSGGNVAALIHPSAAIDPSVQIGGGTVVMAGAVINADARIGNGVIINTCSSVDHDCIVRDCCHIAVGAHLCGTVSVGRRTFIGAGATIINNIDIHEDVVIGAGTVVVRDMIGPGTYVGVPAKKVTG